VETVDPLLWRLVDSGIVSPEYSAASDEAIVNARLAGSAPNTVHFYTRDSPTISIGYNRSVEKSIFIDEAARRNVKVIRRFSGGSAVFTDKGQLIFALVLDASMLPHDIVESYEKVCGAVIRGLSILGIKAEYKPVNDILVGGKKISGSAQLRRGGIVLHHGTMLIDTDLESMDAVLKPPQGRKDDQSVIKQVTSLREALGKAPDMQVLKRALVKGISDAFSVTLCSRDLTKHEADDIGRLIEEKYGSRDWNWKL
jgi:lipoate-protein ligase A